jgi:hypothetical protein
MKMKHQTLVDRNGNTILSVIKPAFGFFGVLIRNGRRVKL